MCDYNAEVKELDWLRVIEELVRSTIMTSVGYVSICSLRLELIDKSKYKFLHYIHNFLIMHDSTS